MPLPSDDPIVAVTRRRDWLWPLLAMALAAFDLSGHLFRDWIPHDEGVLGLSAALVRSGLWPHRDFADVYSGGLALFDAGTQALFGDDLRALRIPLAVAAIGWVGLLAACFRRFVAPPAAAGLALVAFLCGPPIYPSPIPSWYLLFLATAVIWCLLRWQESGRPAWWGAIGLIIGVAIFIKINALFLLAGAGSVLLIDRPAVTETAGTGRSARVTGAVIATPLLVGVLGAALMVHHGWGWNFAVTLIMPLLVLAVTGAARLQASPDEVRAGFLPLVRPLGFLTAGLALVLVPWIMAYWLHGALGPLIEGIFVIPFRRSEFARFTPPELGVVEFLAALALILLHTTKWTRRRADLAALGIILAMAWALIRGWAFDGAVVQGVWRTLRIFGPLAILFGTVDWYQRAPGERRPLVAILWVSGWFALIQYPFAAPVYFIYVAPLMVLTATAVLAVRGTPRLVGAALALAVGAWNVGIGHGQGLYALGFRYHAEFPYERLEQPRGGIEVPQWEAWTYRDVVRTLDAWGARRIVAGPDTPEIYYLGDRPNPDREFFEFTAPDWSAATFARRIVAQHPDAVVLNRLPGFSKVPIDSVVALLPHTWTADTAFGRFRLLRFNGPHASP